MTRTPSLRIAQGDPSDQPSLPRRLRRFLAAELPRLRREVRASARDSDAERYRKHFHSFAHACLLLFHALSGSASLRQSYAAFPYCRPLAQFSGLSGSDDPENDRLAVSFSQLADSNTSRPCAFLAGIVPSLIARVRRIGPSPSALPPELRIVDSTFLRLSLALAPWLPNAPTKADVAGVKVQVDYCPALDIPEHILLTDSHTDDHTGLDRILLDDPIRLAELRGHTLVYDLGYYCHRRFRRLISAGVHLVSRLHPQAKVKVEFPLPIQQPLPSIQAGRIVVLSDQRVTIGSAKNASIVRKLRLVSASVEPSTKAGHRAAEAITYRLLTDRFDLGAAQVVQLYLWRWQIELFFRWLKSHVRLPSLLGYSRNAVELTIYLAIVVHLLTLLAAAHLGFKRRGPTLLAQMGWALLFADPQAEPSQDPALVQPPYPYGNSITLNLLDHLIGQHWGRPRPRRREPGSPGSSLTQSPRPRLDPVPYATAAGHGSRGPETIRAQQYYHPGSTVSLVVQDQLPQPVNLLPLLLQPDPQP